MSAPPYVRMATRQPDPDAVDAGVVARVIVRLLGELSITLGVFLMLFVAWQLWWTDVEANRDQSQQVSSLEQQFQAPADPVAAPVVGEPPPPAAPPAIPGEAFGIIYVPRFGADYARPVLAGTSLDILAKGVGHYIGSAMPGEVGNFAIAGHRTTHGAPFWAIDELQPGDPVVIFTADGYYTYRVRSSEIVRPGAVEVVAPVPDQPGAVPTERLLTMTSCHPRYTARQRFVVHAVFESFQPAAAGPPPAMTGAG